MRLVRSAVFVAVLGGVLGLPGPALADSELSLFGGAVFGGNLGCSGSGCPTAASQGTYGLALGFKGDRALGFEVEGNYTPHFFGHAGTASQNNVASLMGNVVLGAGGGGGRHRGRRGDGARVFATAGLGLLKSHVRTADAFFSLRRSDLGMNAGLGFVSPIGDRWGLRGDVRYFRNLVDPEPDNAFDVDLGRFYYWRATAGLVLRF
jgi:hypothetical protein